MEVEESWRLWRRVSSAESLAEVVEADGPGDRHAVHRSWRGHCGRARGLLERQGPPPNPGRRRVCGELKSSDPHFLLLSFISGCFLLPLFVCNPSVRLSET